MLLGRRDEPLIQFLAGPRLRVHDCRAGNPAGETRAAVIAALHAAEPPGREVAVTTYILLINWTDQGVRNIRDSPKRLDSAKKLLEEMGGAFKATYLTMGEYDLVA